MKNYEPPNLSVTVITKDDILLKSDTFVDVSGLWDEVTPEEYHRFCSDTLNLIQLNSYYLRSREPPVFSPFFRWFAGVLLF